MNALADKLLVGAAVFAATLYAVHALAPKAWRNAWYARFGIKLSDSGSACGGCDSCGPAPTPSAEIKVPVSRIGRRGGASNRSN